MPGIRRRLYYIEKAKIVAWPTLPSPSDQNVKMEDLAKYTGDFTLAENATFKFLDLKDEASNVTFDPVGEDLFHGHVYVLVFFGAEVYGSGFQIAVYRIGVL